MLYNFLIQTINFCAPPLGARGGGDSSDPQVPFIFRYAQIFCFALQLE